MNIYERIYIKEGKSILQCSLCLNGLIFFRHFYQNERRSLAASASEQYMVLTIFWSSALYWINLWLFQKSYTKDNRYTKREWNPAITGHLAGYFESSQNRIDIFCYYRHIQISPPNPAKNGFHSLFVYLLPLVLTFWNELVM